MLVTKPVGRGAAARKYDLITALGAYALSRGKTEQRSVLRLITLITARYNWAIDKLAIGQREIARLWACDERTVKREMAKFRERGWLVVSRQGARGRVTEYRVDLESILDTTRGRWPAVGPDFVTRMEPTPSPASVVPFPAKTKVPQPSLSAVDEWGLAQIALHEENEGVYGAWLAALSRADRIAGCLVLRAPSRFHASYVQANLADRILAACQAIDSEIVEVVVIV